MAKLTPLAKVLMSATVVALTAAAAWQLGVRDLVLGDGSEETEGDGPVSRSLLGGGSEPDAPLGSEDNPLQVSIVSFHGYAPALLANGSSLETTSGSIFAELGVHVEFIIQDDIPTLSTIFESGTAHCAWRTSDFWAQEQPNLRNAGRDARAIMVVDNTQGADAIIARDASIQRVEDLAGRKIGLLQFTPSDGMVIDALDNSSLSKRKQQTVDFIYINADEGTAGVRAAFEAGQVDAAALWDPDLSLALEKVPGAHVVYSTRTATNLIFDVIVCDTEHLERPQNHPAFAAFVEGWMKGVEAAEARPEAAVDALVQTEEFFALLAREEGRDFVRGLFDNLVWTGLEDNARILGLAGGTDHYSRVYRRFDGIYRAAGALADPTSPVIDPSESFDRSFIEGLIEASPSARSEGAKPQFRFDEAQRDRVATREATVTKPVSVSFKTGSAELSKRAQRTIDEEMVPMIENNGSAYFEVSGNTDSTGSRGANLALSRQRADAVVDYLLQEWEFESERFKITGNGPDKPLCDESDPASEGVDLEACRAMNRSTRLAVLSR